MRLRRTNECRGWSCQIGLFDGVWMKSLKEALYRIWCGVNWLADSGVNRLDDTSAFVNTTVQLLLTRWGKIRMDGVGIAFELYTAPFSRQRVVSYLVSQVPSVHAVLVFPWASLVSCLACSGKGCLDRCRFRPDMLAVRISCSLCWSPSSARRDKARHCMFLRIQEVFSRCQLVAWRLVSIEWPNVHVWPTIERYIISLYVAWVPG